MGEDLFQQERIGADRRWQPGPADHEPPEQTQAAWEVSVHYHTVKAANVQLVRAGGLGTNQRLWQLTTVLFQDLGP